MAMTLEGRTEQQKLDEQLVAFRDANCVAAFKDLCIHFKNPRHCPAPALNEDPGGYL
jgi:hypothetical protein